MPSSTSKLFQPIKIGDITLAHRVVLAPLTRLKATKISHVPIVPLLKEYYSQRSSVPGSLLISEATLIAAKTGGYPNVPGIWSEEQIRAWKEVTDKVHLNCSYIFLQLWTPGRAADPSALISEDPSFPFVAPSPVPLSSSPTPVPRALTIAEIKEYVELYARAAKTAIEQAGFDGVEVHAANGYLIDQFLQDVSNQRNDEYGASIEARSKFGLEIIDAIVSAIGPKKTAIRLSPWSSFQDMKMADPIPQFTHFVSALKETHPTLAYLHVVEPRVDNWTDRIPATHETNDFIHAIWGNDRPYISAGGHSPGTAEESAEKGDCVAFGRLYISNPDLPLRLREGIPLAAYHRDRFYVPGDEKDTHVGYIDYPFAMATA